VILGRRWQRSDEAAALPYPVASPARLDARGTPRAPEDLAAHDCIVFDSIHAPTSWSFHRDTTDLTIAARSRIIVCNIEDALEAALVGIGLTRAQSYQVTNSVVARRTANRARRISTSAHAN